MKCQIKHTFLSPELFLSEHYFIPTKSIMSRSMFEWNILKVCVTNMLKWGGTNHHVITIKRNRVNFSLPATTLRRETHLNLHHEHRAKPCKIHLFTTGVSTEASFAAPMELLTLGKKKKRNDRSQSKWDWLYCKNHFYYFFLPPVGNTKLFL